MCSSDLAKTSATVTVTLYRYSAVTGGTTAYAATADTTTGAHNFSVTVSTAPTVAGGDLYYFGTTATWNNGDAVSGIWLTYDHP